MAVSTAKSFLFIYNIIFFIIGLGCIAVGLWMKADPNVVSWFIVFRRGITDEALSSGAILLICAGFVIAGIAFMGCYGALRDNKCLLYTYLFIIILIVIFQFTAGFMAVVFKDQIHIFVKQGMKSTLEQYYEFDNTIGRAWNLVQVRYQCCGVDDSSDYENSQWRHNQRLADPDTIIFVPKTCCVLQQDQAANPFWIDPQQARPRDMRRCQEDAQGRRFSGSNLHGAGCFLKLLNLIQQNANILIGIGVAVGLFQFIGIVLVLISLRNQNKDAHNTTKTSHVMRADT